MPFNVIQFRQHFPAINNAGTYLDSAATTLKPQVVIDATQQFYSLTAGTVHRSQFSAAHNLTERYEDTRCQVARLLNAPAPHNIVWTRGTTEAINLVAQSYLRPRLQPGDEIIVSEMEHHANLIPWLMVAEQTGAKVVKWPLGQDLLPDITQLPSLLTDKTRLLAVSQMSNVTGGCPDIARAITLAHQAGSKVMVDGAQGIAHMPVDVQALDIDFYAFSAHKLYGPTGIGVLFAKEALLAVMPPWQGGGKMLSKASFDHFTPLPVPWRFEAGTPNVAGVIGLSAALKWLESVDLPAAECWCCHLASLAEEKLTALPGFRSFRCQTSSVLSFNITGLHHNDVMTLLAEDGIALRAGQHCAQPLMTALGINGTLRASFAPYNIEQDTDILLQTVQKAMTLLAD